MNALIKERRLKTSQDVKKIAKELQLTKEEEADFLFDADCNAIWDAKDNLEYRIPIYRKKTQVEKPMYTELTFSTK